jgi:hypothetical protein
MLEFPLYMAYGKIIKTEARRALQYRAYKVRGLPVISHPFFALKLIYYWQKSVDGANQQ